jgi:hypothetical protein
MITNLLINLDKRLGSKRYKVEQIDGLRSLTGHIPLTPKLYSSKRLFHQWFAVNYKNLWSMYNFVLEQLHQCRLLNFKTSTQTFLEFSYWVWRHTDTQHYTFRV